MRSGLVLIGRDSLCGLGSGARLIRREAGAVTLYLDNVEVKLTTTTGALSSTRYYVFNGDTVAVRSSDGTTLGALRLFISDHQGTADLSVDAATDAVSRRRFMPFGQARGTSPLWPSERAFVGGTADPSTGLVHLGARVRPDHRPVHRRRV